MKASLSSSRTRITVWSAPLAALLAAFATLAPRACAQWEYRSPIRFDTISDFGGYNALDVAAQAGGAIYSVNIYSGAICKFSPDGTATTIEAFVRTADSGDLPLSFANGGATDIALDADGNIYVVGNGAVYRVAPDGAVNLLANGLGQGLGIARDEIGNLYIADRSRHVIRRISPDGTMDIFAGKADEPGSSDGIANARFEYPTGVAVDTRGTVFVIDSGNSTIRKITPDGIVSTLAGQAGQQGIVDGSGSAARFQQPGGIAIDRFDNVYVIDSSWFFPDTPYVIRRITPEGVVSTLRGTTSYDYTGAVSIAVDRNGVIYLTDWWDGVILASGAPPRFAAPLTSQVAVQGATATFTVDVVSTETVDFQWLKDGVAIPGATSATLTVGDVQASDLGSYSVRVTDSVGSSVSNSASLSLAGTRGDALANLSIRGRAGAGAETLILGFVVDGDDSGGTKPLLLRGVGPALDSLGVPSALRDPKLTVYSGAVTIAENDNWNGQSEVSTIGAQVGAFALASTTSRDAALYHPALACGAYTAQISGVDGSAGVALAEIYDATAIGTFDATTPRLVNMSARAYVGTGADVLIGGFTIGGTTPRTLLIRAIGPTLGQFGVTGFLENPQLELYQQGSTILESNDDWAGNAELMDAAANVGAFPLDNSHRDAALLVSLLPGSYTVHVSGATSNTGIALLEIYEVP